MKQSKLITELQRAAEKFGKPLVVETNRRGVRLATANGSIQLGPKRSQDVHQRHHARYLKTLGIPELCLGSR